MEGRNQPRYQLAMNIYHQLISFLDKADDEQTQSNKSMSTQLCRFSWSDLPVELLQSIADHLKPNYHDLHSFRCVCKQWRSSIPPAPFTLTPFLPYTIPCPFASYSPSYTIVSTAVYLLRPPHRPSEPGCLVAFEQPSPGKVRLFHPLTRLRLPITSLPKNFAKIMSLSFRYELSKGFDMRCIKGKSVLEYKVKKVLLWPNPDRRTLGIEQSSLLLLQETGDLLCLRLQGNFSCIPLFSAEASKFDDIAIRNGMLIALDRFGRLYGFDYNMKKATTKFVALPVFSLPANSRKCLLLDSNTDELYLVVSYQGTKDHTNFKVYRLNLKRGGVWDELISLGDRVLFVSFHTCFFVQARDLPGFEGNSVVFPCIRLHHWRTATKHFYSKVFHGTQNSKVGVHKYGECDNFKLIEDCPGFSDALWPPAQWVWEDKPTSHRDCANEEEEESQLIPQLNMLLMKIALQKSSSKS